MYGFASGNLYSLIAGLNDWTNVIEKKRVHCIVHSKTYNLLYALRLILCVLIARLCSGFEARLPCAEGAADLDQAHVCRHGAPAWAVQRSGGPGKVGHPGLLQACAPPDGFGEILFCEGRSVILYTTVRSEPYSASRGLFPFVQYGSSCYVVSCFLSCFVFIFILFHFLGLFAFFNFALC